MIKIGDQTCMEWSFESLEASNSEIIFIVRKETVNNFPDFPDFLRKVATISNVSVFEIDSETRGSLETCAIVANTLEGDASLSIFTGDVYFLPIYNPLDFVNENFDGWLLSFKSNSSNYSYARVDSKGFATETAEKITISEHALVGVYGFKSVEYFQKYAQIALGEPPEFGGEYYIAPIYNKILRDKGVVKVRPVEEMHLFGTPQELSFFRNFSSRSFKSKKIIGLCSDHSGWQLKEVIKQILAELEISYIDFGAYVEVDSDYPDFVEPAMKSLLRGDVDYVFTSCRSGQGVNLAASGFQGVISALVYDLESASLAVKHSSANVFSFPSKAWDKPSIAKAISLIISQRFEGGRHQGRIMRVVGEYLKNA